MTLSQEAVQARREYARQWREKNKDKVREYDRKHWEKKAMQDKEEASQEG